MESPRTVGLALGSGASRGWAHIGAIEALREENIPIDFIAGCSIGAYVGALYAAGSLESLKAFVLKMSGKNVFSYFDVVFPRSGLLNGTKRVRELFSMHTDITDFSQMHIPVMMVATDLKTGDKVVLNSGNLLEALRATMSIPGLFAPARIKGRFLVDGALVDPVPVGVARAMGADVVIALDLAGGLPSRKKRDQCTIETPAQFSSVNLDHNRPSEITAAVKQLAIETAPTTAVLAAQNETAPPAAKSELLQKLSDFYASAENSFRSKINELFQRESDMPDILETVMSSIDIMQGRITRINLAVDPPDILIQPRLRELKMMDFDQVEHVIEEGYIGVKENIEDIRALLEPRYRA